jgi:ABC-2 type transport system permease protein
MKKHIVWLKTEYKRAAIELPLAVKRAAICAIVLSAIACMVAFCTVKYFSNNEIAKIKVGYVADDNIITQMAISYVENMESIDSICVLEKMDNEDIGLEQLEKGEIAALVVLPENVVDEINYGTNTHGTLFLPANSSDIDINSGIGNVAVMLFEELAGAGMGMLKTAQAEIYATYSIFNAAGEQFDSTEYDAMYNDIDRFNLTMVGQREDLFKTKSLLVTGNDTYVVYYAGALLTIYLMLAGLLYGTYCKRSYLEQLIAKRRRGISFSYQLLCRYLAGTVISIAIVILPLLLSFVPPIHALISITLSHEGIIAVLMATIFITIFNMLVFELAQNRQTAIVIIGFNAVLQSYMSGCIVPSVLLPDKIAKVGEYLPASYLRGAFRILITGRKNDLKSIVGGLILWSIILFLITLVAIWLKQGIMPSFEDNEGNKNNIESKAANYKIPSLPMVVLRRFLHKKSIWICLIIIAVASILIVRTEKTSDNKITVAFYDESGDFGEILGEYEGLVSFVGYDSEEALKQAVLRDEVECGYIIPKNLTERMLSYMSNGLVTVYCDDDSVSVPVVNEVIFERIFKQVSLKWYENYISGYDESLIDSVDSAVEEKLSAGITFDIDVRRIGKAVEVEYKATYPVVLVAVLIVAICTIYGIAQVISDIWQKRFYRCQKQLIYAFTILIPLFFGIVTGIIIISIIVNMGQYSY